MRAVYPATEYPHITYVQDNAQIHTARATMAWFNLHRDIRPIQWLSRSADLNPIQHLWGLWFNAETVKMKETLMLLDHTVLEYGMISYRSMRDILRAVIAAEGGYTRFQIQIFEVSCLLFLHILS